MLISLISFLIYLSGQWSNTKRKLILKWAFAFAWGPAMLLNNYKYPPLLIVIEGIQCPCKVGRMYHVSLHMPNNCKFLNHANYETISTELYLELHKRVACLHFIVLAVLQGHGDYIYIYIYSDSFFWLSRGAMVWQNKVSGERLSPHSPPPCIQPCQNGKNNEKYIELDEVRLVLTSHIFL